MQFCELYMGLTVNSIMTKLWSRGCWLIFEVMHYDSLQTILLPLLDRVWLGSYAGVVVQFTQLLLVKSPCRMDRFMVRGLVQFPIDNINSYNHVYSALYSIDTQRFV